MKPAQTYKHTNKQVHYNHRETTAQQIGDIRLSYNSTSNNNDNNNNNQETEM